MVDYGCLFCRSGSEERIISELKISHPGMKCLSAKRVRVRRQGDVNQTALFPGYIFFRVTIATDFRTIIQKTDVYRLLQYPNGEWRLSGTDLHIAMFIFEMGGVIGLSKARFMDNGVEIISGPLKEYEAGITKIDKRMKTARVEIPFHGEKLIMWLGFEIE